MRQIFLSQHVEPQPGRPAQTRLMEVFDRIRSQGTKVYRTFVTINDVNYTFFTTGPDIHSSLGQFSTPDELATLALFLAEECGEENLAQLLFYPQGKRGPAWKVFGYRHKDGGRLFDIEKVDRMKPSPSE